MELRVVTLLTVFTVLPMILRAQSTECSVHVPKNGTAILQVNIGIPLDLNDLMVEWKCGEKFVHLFQNGGDYSGTQDQEYKGRTSVFKDEISRGNVSLKLMNVTEEDAGTYSLTLRGSNIADDQRKHSVSLCVEKTEDDPMVGEPETPVWVMGLIAGVVVVVIAGLLFLLYKCRQRTSCWKQNKQEKGQDKDEGKDEDERKDPTSSDDQHKLGDPVPGKEPVGNEINGENPEERSRLLKEQPKKS